MPFVEYKGIPKNNNVDFVSVNTNGTITISKSTVEKYFKDIECVVFLYDPQTKIFAIRPISDCDDFPHAYKLRKTGRMTQISAKAFLSEVGVAPKEKSVRFICEWNEDIKAVVTRRLH